MANNRKDCPKHTTGNGPCYCQYHKDTDSVYIAPDDVKINMSVICAILRGRKPEQVTPYIAAKVRRANLEFMGIRLSTLSGDNLVRGFSTMINLDQ